MTTPTQIESKASIHHSSAALSAPERRLYWVVLPAYNEERSLPPLLDRIAKAMFEWNAPYRIVVVDDGSSDSTARIAEEYARNIPLVLERHTVNLGLGMTIRDGLLKAIEMANPRDIIVTMDADNSHNPELIARMGQLVREGNDVVIASRYQHGSTTRGVSGFRRFLSFGAGLLFRIAFPIPSVRDYTCGFRAYRAEALKRAREHYGQAMFDQQGFQCMVDILLKLRRLDLIFTEVPMVLRYDQKESPSKMQVGRTIGNTLLLMFKRRLGF
jgi:dolichol-phosphate mannosyltransferase